MKIEIINTGSELMLGYVLNTHQQWLCRQLSERGYTVTRQVAVDDTAPAIQSAVRDAISRADLIITTGGLGPTSDDRTRDLIAELLQRPLRQDPEILARIEGFFGKRKRPVPASTRVQAMVPEGAVVLQNENGTAPGLAIDFQSATGTGLLIMLPGPPRELRPMFLNQALPLVTQRFGPAPDFCCSVLRTVGIGESFLEEKIAPDLGPLIARGLDVGYCARVGEVDLRFVARCPSAEPLVREAEQIAQHHLRSFIYGREAEGLDAAIVKRLTELNKTLALAESCTGGYIANRITNIPGASAIFRASLVTYSNEAKQTFLGVRPEILAEHGAVSEPVAREMAEGARQRTGADFALAVTGIAGPSGGSPEKPVGTVYIALASAAGTEVKKNLNQYDRETFKFLTSQQALDLLRKALT
ncbi:MAG TPA: competence/damage-inducible protein A [Verrucomicrobiae bacterium]